MEHRTLDKHVSVSYIFPGPIRRKVRWPPTRAISKLGSCSSNILYIPSAAIMWRLWGSEMSSVVTIWGLKGKSLTSNISETVWNFSKRLLTEVCPLWALQNPSTLSECRVPFTFYHRIMLRRRQQNDSDHAECEGVSIDSVLFFLHPPIEEYGLHCFSMATFLFMDRFLRRSQGFLPRIRRF